MLGKRSSSGIASLVALALTLFACGADPETAQAPESNGEQVQQEDQAPAPADDRESLRIGVLMPQTGQAASAGQESIAGFELYWEERGYQSGGRAIEVVTGDSEGDASTAVAEAQRLVQAEDIDLMFGPLITPAALGVGDYLEQVGIPQIYGAMTNDTWLREGAPENLFSFNVSLAQVGLPLGRWAVEQGFEQVATVCADYVTGWEVCGGFVNAFNSYGGEVVLQQWPPLAAPDYAPAISQVQAVLDDIDALYLGTPIADAVSFFRAWQDFGLVDEVPILTHQVVVDPSQLEGMGPGAEGIISISSYSEANPSPVTAEFVEAYDERSGRLPTSWDASGFFAATLIDEALTELDGELSSTEEFLEVLRSIELEDSVYGPWRTDDDTHLPVTTIFLREARDRGDGVLWNEIIDAFEDVGPSYDFDLDAYLEQPPYGQDYQGIGWPENCDDFSGDCPL